MDELTRDPELAPEFVRLLSEKLVETRRALDESRRESIDLRDEIHQLHRQKADAFASESNNQEEEQRDNHVTLAQEIGHVRQALAESNQYAQDTAEENSNLREEIERLRGQLSLHSSDASSWQQDVKPLTTCWARLCPAKNDIRSLHQQNSVLKLQLADSEHALERNEKCRDSELQLDILTAKKKTYKKKLYASRREVTSLTSRIQLLQNEVVRLEELKYTREQSVSNADAEQNESTARRDGDDTSQHTGGWVSECDRKEIRSDDESDDESDDDRGEEDAADMPTDVNTSVVTPCIDPSRTPYDLPAHVRELSTARAVILLWPGQTRQLHGKNNRKAHIFASPSKCDTSTEPISWIKIEPSLQGITGGTRELFRAVHGSVHYLGMYRCVSASHYYSQDEFRQLDKEFKEDILKQTFIRPSQYRSLSRRNRDHIIDLYSQGKVQVQYLHLEFVKFNQDYFNALIDLKIQDETKHASNKRKRESSGGRGAIRRKKTRRE
ncbi:uncharacterized protein PHACADRAFT_191228 [Phanerochaete carnosa HHB-10118-sp]|uniref:DUF6697 domain-containing protein n=1 Tax=Phanerochaete carnosa (strain HHB-10118-sp) TaxID=650164 RepID=K5X7U6_PHACS|nr:uncharacterized protein PHACADRAFT_191228 [Phanerochaete carnosa HHB-10118-sp]EKM58922.1 hypothetical protein PHACADRAFT_191228 [Phanerochaete carnosa HHB-10118-sp]